MILCFFDDMIEIHHGCFMENSRTSGYKLLNNDLQILEDMNSLNSSAKDQGRLNSRERYGDVLIQQIHSNKLYSSPSPPEDEKAPHTVQTVPVRQGNVSMERNLKLRNLWYV